MAATELCTISATLREHSKATESRGRGLEASSPRCNTRQGLEFDGTTANRALHGGGFLCSSARSEIDTRAASCVDRGKRRSRGRSTEVL